MNIAMKNGVVLFVNWIEPYKENPEFLYVIFPDGHDLLVKISEISYIEKR